jgi:hypothetical protein
MFRAIKDTNTGVVYDWVKKQEDGSEVSVNIPAELWKREQDWTSEEIAALFSAPVVASTQVPTNEAAPEDPSSI